MHKILNSIYTLIIGHWVTFKHLFKKSVTLEYPEKRPVLSDKFRGRHVFDASKCRLCRICTKVCPANAIKITVENNELKNFEIDFSRCIFCGNCVQYCSANALSMSKEFELATDDKSTLNLDINSLKNNVDYTIIDREEK